MTSGESLSPTPLQRAATAHRPDHLRPHTTSIPPWATSRVYPEEVIQAHRAFIARRRALRPSEEYRDPTDAEWDEFLAHFELRKVALGICGRAYGTPCIHEHSCLRCSMHWPDPAQRHRLAEIRDNLTARIAEAEHEGWLGEAEGLKISLAGAQDKLAQIDRRSHPPPFTSASPQPVPPSNRAAQGPSRPRRSSSENGISPELADVLSTIIKRIRGAGQAVPLVAAYDDHERLWLPPAPVLFQRRIGAENRAIPTATVRKLLTSALARTGLTSPDGGPLHYTLHDFRRMFLTDVIMSGLPPHIAQIIAGHRDINVTLGYKAVYPDEAIQAHLAFLARRRALRPTEEYRTPTDAEWEEFLGHFERRKVATGICGRAFASPCIHEHSCLRCALHWPDPAQRDRITEIRDNLIARITEAEREGWLGEAEGLKISLTGAEDKLAQIDRRSRPATTDLGMPATARQA